MDERIHDQQEINAESDDGGLLRACGERVRWAAEDVGWLMRKRIAWPVENLWSALGARGMIGVFGGGGIAVAGVVAAIIVASPGSGSAGNGVTEAFVTPSRPAPTKVVVPQAKPKKKQAAKPTGPTLHGAPPSFTPAKKTKSGVGAAQSLGGGERHAASPASAGVAPAARGSSAGAGDTPASTARIGATPQASAAATAQTDSLGATGALKVGAGKEAETEELVGPPAPKAAKRVARHFAEAFVVYETEGVDSGVRNTFGATTTKQLSKSLLKRPPRQPANVKVPRAKVVTVVSGPSKGSVYEVSVSLLRVGVTSELRLELEQGVGKKWQVTNVLG